MHVLALNRAQWVRNRIKVLSRRSPRAKILIFDLLQTHNMTASFGFVHPAWGFLALFPNMQKLRF